MEIRHIADGPKLVGSLAALLERRKRAYLGDYVADKLPLQFELTVLVVDHAFVENPVLDIDCLPSK